MDSRIIAPQKTILRLKSIVSFLPYLGPEKHPGIPTHSV